jgi:hypothetical protein
MFACIFLLYIYHIKVWWTSSLTSIDRCILLWVVLMARVWFTKDWVPQCESKVGMVNDYVLTNPPSDDPIPVVHSCLGEDVSHGATKPARTLMVLLDHVEPIVCTIPQFINLSSSKIIMEYASPPTCSCLHLPHHGRCPHPPHTPPFSTQSKIYWGWAMAMDPIPSWMVPSYNGPTQHAMWRYPRNLNFAQ